MLGKTRDFIDICPRVDIMSVNMPDHDVSSLLPLILSVSPVALDAVLTKPVSSG